ncbi:S9 family peptidase [soil metagenome]
MTYPSITQVAEPYLKLAGVRLEPRTRRKHDTNGGYGVAPCAQTFALVEVSTSKETPIALPAGGCADAIAWAADGKHFAFRNTSTTAVEQWIGDGVTGAIHRLGTVKLNPMLGASFQWMPDQKTLLVKAVPVDQGPPPAGSVAADGPSIQETGGEKGQSSTYETRDTLQSKHDEDLFEYYATSQLAFVDIASGAVTNVGTPAAYTAVDPSPDGTVILAAAIKRPYSYVTTFPNFAHDVITMDRKGALIKLIASLPVADRIPIAGVAMGPREFGWRATDPATLYWSEALDHGDWNVKVPFRDKVMMQKAPFTAPASEIARTEQRAVSLDWGEKPGFALLEEYDENKHWRRTFVTNVDEPKTKPTVLWDLSSDEHYKDPGSPVHRVLPNGQYVIRQTGAAIFTAGEGATPAGDRPFLDRWDPANKKSTRLFQSDEKGLEYFIAFTGPSETSFITWHQSPTDVPNAFARTIGTKEARAITHIPDPAPSVRSIKKRLVKYKRKDGVELSFTLMTPPGYIEGTKLPAVLYAYPLDYASASTAGQVSTSDQVFDRISDYRLLLLSGYAIIDNAAFPIVGDPKKAYDTYLEQLEMDAQAAVDKAVSLGVVDRDRIGVTGHSHGALMTANLVAHTKLFAAGVATSGSYNKTLTPFGFQSERRSVWAAPQVYTKVSPFFVADAFKAPLLIMHGAEDANPGTTPLQATKLYEAIRGNGGIARLVMLPHEPHWYSAMESNEQLAYEEVRWFDKYVKNKR